jgi:hypothetical protein
MNEPLRVFLCHASEDKPAVREMYMWLASSGFRPWLDEYDLIPGQEWEREIPRAVAKSDCVLVFMSHHSTTKRGYIQKEIRLALEAADQMPEGSIFIIPILLEECTVPESLRRWQWLDLTGKDSRKRLKQALLEVIPANNIQPSAKVIRDISSGIKEGIRDAMRHYHLTQVNTQLVWLYWNIGRQVHLRTEELGVSPSQIIGGISKQLVKDFGRGFSKTNIMYMYTFSRLFPNPEMLPSNLTWSHCRILTKLHDDDARYFYLSVCSQTGWSTRTLQRQIASMLYERTKLSRRSREVPDPAVRDPYVFKFLGLREEDGQSVGPGEHENDE